MGFSPKYLALFVSIYICMNAHFDLVPIFTGVKSLREVQCNRKHQAHDISLSSRPSGPYFQLV